MSNYEVGIDGYQPLGMYYADSEGDAIKQCKSEISFGKIDIRMELDIPRGEYINWIAVKQKS